MKINHPLPVFLILISILLVFPGGCHTDSPKLRALDLHQHGLPLTVMAPDSSEVLAKDYTFMRDITVRKGDSYFLQIFEFEAPVLDAAGEKLRQLAAVREDPFFNEIIKEEDSGFIFSKFIDSTMVDFDFRYIRIVDQKELIFQTGLTGTFSLDDVKTMYNAVQ